MKDEISLKFQEIDMYYEPISEKHDSAIAELIRCSHWIECDSNRKEALMSTQNKMVIPARGEVHVL